MTLRVCEEIKNAQTGSLLEKLRMDVSPPSVAVDPSELSPFTFLYFANMFTQCHEARLQPYLLVYLMAGMLAQRVKPVRVMAAIKTDAFWWHSRRFWVRE